MPYKDRATYLAKQREFAARRKARKQLNKAVSALTPSPPRPSSNLIEQAPKGNTSAMPHKSASIKRVNPINPVNPATRPEQRIVSSPKCINCGDTGLLGGSVPCPKCDAGLRAELRLPK